MDFLRKLFKKEMPENASGSGESPKVAPSSSKSQQLQGILVLSRQPMEQSAVLALTQQILDEQKSFGHTVAEGFIAKHTAAGPDVDDEMYAYGKIRSEFSKFGDAELLKRTKVFPYQIPGGGSGKFYILYDRR